MYRYNYIYVYKHFNFSPTCPSTSGGFKNSRIVTMLKKELNILIKDWRPMQNYKIYDKKRGFRAIKSQIFPIFTK